MSTPRNGSADPPLLAGVTFGRLVFTRQALPSVRPVGHMLVDGDIVVRTHEDAALTPHGEESDGRGVVVAYQADCIDRSRWHVSTPS